MECGIDASATANSLGQMLTMTLWFKVEFLLDWTPAVIFDQPDRRTLAAECGRANTLAEAFGLIL
jgi:hypothetical protein